jgi:putative endonuclease
MAWVYILRGANSRHYIGATDDLDRRLAEHRRGGAHTTSRLGGNIQLAACREVSSMKEARALESALKRKKNARLAIYMLSEGQPAAQGA